MESTCLTALTHARSKEATRILCQQALANPAYQTELLLALRSAGVGIREVSAFDTLLWFVLWG